MWLKKTLYRSSGSFNLLAIDKNDVKVMTGDIFIYTDWECAHNVESKKVQNNNLD